MTHRMIGAALAYTLALSPGVFGQSVNDEAATLNPLAEFGELAVGEWTSADSRHVLEWGVGQMSIQSRSYFGTEGDWTLVSEGMWFWDPALETIRGVAVAIEMPVSLFEYASRVEAGVVIHDLQAHGQGGGHFQEVWTFGEDSYDWALYPSSGEGDRLMGGAYKRGG